MKKNIFILIVAAVLSALAFTSCMNEEKYAAAEKVNLIFSSDTITFDTVFTTVGSVTKQIRIFNPLNEDIKLDYVTVAGGNGSYYRLNVDGDTSLVAKNVVIGAKDSIFVFVRAELDANNQNNPFLIEDSIIFVSGSKTQSVLLMAYGQDAYYHKNNTLIPFGSDSLVCNLANEGGIDAGVEVSGNVIQWKHDKPHVIIGNCVVKSGYTLQLSENTKIHFGNNSSFVVNNGATLEAAGTVNEPVVFQSLRTQGRYANIPGQWGMIWFTPGSKDNKLNNVVIKNATVGLLADTCVNNNHTVEIKNTRIENCSQVGLYARGADIYAENTIVQNTASYTVALTLGGSYEFIGCTFANYWTYDNTSAKPVLLLNDWYEAVGGQIQYRQIDKCGFHNVIVYGSGVGSDIEFDLLPNGQSNYSFDHCLLKLENATNDNSKYKDCVFNKDPMFSDAGSNDLHLLEGSPAIKAGNGIYNGVVPYDIFGTYRSDPPSIGAIEK